MVKQSTDKTNRRIDNSKYDPWAKMDEAIENYRRNEELGTIIFTSKEKIVIKITFSNSNSHKDMLS